MLKRSIQCSLRAAAGVAAFGVLACASAVRVAGAQNTRQQELLYVCVQDDARIAIIDMNSQTLLRTIDLQKLGYTATAKPHYIVVEPDGAHFYVSLIGANRVVKFDRRDSVVGTFEMEVPGMMSLGVGSEVLAVSRSMSAVNPPSRVGVIRRTTMQGDELDVLFPRPHPMLIAPNGYAYTGSLGVNQLASIRLEDDHVELVRIPGPTHSMVQFAISPDGRTLVASTDVSGQLLVFSLADPAKPELVKSIPVGAMAFDPAFTPDGRFVYVPVKSSNEISVIETSGWTVDRKIAAPEFKQPHQVVFSSDGSVAFISNNNKMDHMADPAMAGHAMHAADAAGGNASLVILDVRTGKVIRSIELGKNLTGMNTRAPR